MPAYADILSGGDQNIPKDNLYERGPKDDIVVSGMSGRFPESSNIEEFSKNLFDGVDMVTESDQRWTPGIHGLPKRHGKIPDLAHFDAAFFGVSPRQAHVMDPQLRNLLEVTHEAIFDAGVHPSSLKGKNIGVYVGVSSSETEDAISADPEKIIGYELPGCSRSMFPNRISYTLDLKGPSFAVDTACSSALIALTTAWNAMVAGQIDGALVCGSSLTLKPQNSMMFNALSMLSKDGKCQAFDHKANGYVRAEAINAVFLQKRSDAIRFYGQIVYAGANTDGYKTEGITFPSGEVQKTLLRSVYKNAEIDPAKVTYVEAHGTGTKAGDPQELSAISGVFCSHGRQQNPLLIGSVKSNMGHSEPASGLCSLIKVLLAFQKQEIPANLHFEKVNPDIPSLNDGKIKVVSENTPWRGEYAAVNCFGFGGANAHILLKSCENTIQSNTNVLKAINSSYNLIMAGAPPRLFTASGRTEEHVQTILNEFQKNRNVSFASLFDNINQYPSNPGMYPFKGYTIAGGHLDQVDPVIHVNECPNEKRPIWLVFTGMGSQWTGCGKELLSIPIFEEVIQRCRSVLLPLGLDLVHLLTKVDGDPLENLTCANTVICAVQVALVELLKYVGITEWEGIIGHSIGEMGCGYADGALTLEQAVLASYWRGRCVQEVDLPVGLMAAVGLTSEEVEKYFEKDSTVAVACRNAAKSVTISGLKEEVEVIMKKLEADGVFCRAVDSNGTAFHHPSLKLAAPQLLSELQKVIYSPVNRSPKWISTSIPEEKWGSGLARKCSPEYLVNNLVSPVIFDKALEKIPKGALILEISPHSLLQAILRRALPSCTLIPLVRKDAKSTHIHLLEALGKLFCNGVRVDLKKLYTETTFPVEVQTPSIASLVKWDHQVEWDVVKFTGNATTREFKVEVDLNDQSYGFIEGHTIDGRVLFPATGYMTLAWKALAKMVHKKWEELPVTFNDVTLHQATVLTAGNKGGVTFTVRIILNIGQFEVLAGETLAASGKIHVGVKETSEREALRKILTKECPDFFTVKNEPIKAQNNLVVAQNNPFIAQNGPVIAQNSPVIVQNGPVISQNESITDKNSPIITENGQDSLESTPNGPKNVEKLTHNEIYKELALRGYQYGGVFRGIQYSDIEGTIGQISWKDNWISMLDTMLQFSLLGSPLKGLYLPTRIRKLCVDPFEFMNNLVVKENTCQIRHSKELGVTMCPGVEIHGLKATMAPRKPPSDNPVLESYDFYPYDLKRGFETSRELTYEEGVRLLLDVVLENTTQLKVKIGHLSGPESLDSTTSLPLLISKTLEIHPMLSLDYILKPYYQPLNKNEKQQLNSADIKIVENIDMATSGKLSLFILSDRLLVDEKLSLISSLNEKAFLLVENERAKNDLLNMGLIQVAMVEKFGIFLLKKPNMEKHYDVMEVNSRDSEFSWVPTLQEKIADQESKNLPLWLVASGNNVNGLLGMAKCLRREPGGERLRIIVDAGNKIKQNSEKWRQIIAHDLVYNIIIDDNWGSMRHLPLLPPEKQKSSYTYLNVLTRGDLSSLTWLLASHPTPNHEKLEKVNSFPASELKKSEKSPENLIPNHEKTRKITSYQTLESEKSKKVPEKLLFCTVGYAPLNFRDIMLASGKLPPDALPGNLAQRECILGLEFAGISEEGKRVMGLVAAGGLASTVYGDPYLMWDIPCSWSMKDAATVPVVYSTAYYALVIRGGLNLGESVLIHAGSGGVGQAAISIALSRGCTVFTTVSSEKKREYLKNRFPQLTDRNFSNSRDGTFEFHILQQTKGQGVDLVLNSLAGDLLQSSVRCLKQHGRFLEIGKADLANNSALGMSIFLKNITFHGILLDALFDGSIESKRSLQNAVYDGISKGEVVPLSATTFKYYEAEEAFRFMAGGKHIGKVLLEISPETDKNLPENIPKNCNENSSKIIPEKLENSENKPEKLENSENLTEILENSKNKPEKLENNENVRRNMSKNSKAMLNNLNIESKSKKYENTHKNITEQSQNTENTSKYQIIPENIQNTTKKSNETHKNTTENHYTHSKENKIEASFRFWARPNGVYIITGGLGGLGLELTDWLLNRGAKNIVLTSRKGISTGYQALCMKRWSTSGANIIVSKQDASTPENAFKLIQDSSVYGPVVGIFHLAVVLEDSAFVNQNSEKFKRVSRVKSDGAASLDIASRRLCPGLHLWVTFSSVACGKGNAGQTNYGWANSVSERVVEARVADGLPGLAIQWGGIADVGVLADTLGNVEVAGTKPQSIRSVMTVLDDLIGSRQPVVCSVCLSTKRSSSGSDGKTIVSSLANILGIRDITKAPLNVSLGDLGMDSLMAVEIKQTLEREADIVMSPEHIRDLTLKKIIDLDKKEGESEDFDDGTEKSLRSKSPEIQAQFSWLDFPLVAQNDLKIIQDSKTASPPFFIASPIQGTCDVLTHMASFLDTRVIGLEYSPELSSTDIEIMASRLIDRIENHLPAGEFHLGGYSYGAGIAYEIASQLESRGRKPLTLTLLDGSHSYVSDIIDSYVMKYQSENLVSTDLANTETTEALSKEHMERLVSAQGQSEALVTFALQFAQIDAKSLKNSLMLLPNFEKRLEFAASSILVEIEKIKRKTSTQSLTTGEIKVAATLFYNRLVASFHRKLPVEEVTTPTLLVRASQNTHMSKHGKDYGLSKVVRAQLRIQEVSGNHESFILGKNGAEVAKYINNFHQELTKN